jgi:sphingomyelin phosphodiesterase
LLSIFDFQGEVIYVLKRINLGADEICSFIIGDACGDIYNPYHEWEVDIPAVPKPEVRELDLPKEGKPTFKVLHLSDTHYDPYYAEGKWLFLIEFIISLEDPKPALRSISL